MNYSAPLRSLKQVSTAPLPVWAAIVAFFCGFSLIFLRFSELANLQWDFGAYYVSAKTIFAGGNPYDPDSTLAAGAAIREADFFGLLYLYPPFFLRMLYPLIHLDLFSASFCWFVLKCAAIEGSIFFTAYLLGIPVNIFSLTSLNGAALIYRPLSLDLAAGNVAVFEMFFALAAFSSWRKGWEGFCGGFIGLCGSLKITPWFMMIFPLHLRRYNLLKGFALTIVSLVLVSAVDWNATREYMAFSHGDIAVHHWDEQVQSIYNISLNSFILRTFGSTYFYDPLIDAPELIPILTPLAPIILFVLFILILNKDKRSYQEMIHNNSFLSALLLLSLLVSPRMAGYTLAWTFFPAIQIFYEGFRRKKLGIILLNLAGLALILWYTPPSSIHRGIEQLLIDRELFGLIIFYVSSLRLYYLSIELSSGQ